jgi:hypothetical protein
VQCPEIRSLSVMAMVSLSWPPAGSWPPSLDGGEDQAAEESWTPRARLVLFATAWVGQPTAVLSAIAKECGVSRWEGVEGRFPVDPDDPPVEWVLGEAGLWPLVSGRHSVPDFPGEERVLRLGETGHYLRIRFLRLGREFLHLLQLP